MEGRLRAETEKDQRGNKTNSGSERCLKKRREEERW
jgi:hypothetical protein